MPLTLSMASNQSQAFVPDRFFQIVEDLALV